MRVSSAMSLQLSRDFTPGPQGISLWNILCSVARRSILSPVFLIQHLLVYIRREQGAQELAISVCLSVPLVITC